MGHCRSATHYTTKDIRNQAQAQLHIAEVRLDIWISNRALFLYGKLAFTEPLVIELMSHNIQS
jgi:hypothetical protein